MRKLKLQMQMSLDGFVAGPNGEEDWVVRGSDPKLWQLINELADTSDTLLLGRKMSEAFIPHFESFTSDNPRYTFAQKMVNLKKYVFSRTLQSPFGQNTQLVKGELADEITKLKSQKGKDMLVYGGASFVSSLVAGGHVDDFYIFLNPVLINKGMRIFDKLTERQSLALVSATAYDGGCYSIALSTKNIVSKTDIGSLKSPFRLSIIPKSAALPSFLVQNSVSLDK